MKVEFDPANAAEVAAVQRLIGGAGGATPAASVAAPTPAPVPASAPAPTRAPAPTMAPMPAPASAVSQADFAAAVQNYAKVNSPKATKAKFAEFGFTKISDVPPERYAEIMPHFAA